MRSEKRAIAKSPEYGMLGRHGRSCFLSIAVMSGFAASSVLAAFAVNSCVYSRSLETTDPQHQYVAKLVCDYGADIGTRISYRKPYKDRDAGWEWKLRMDFGKLTFVATAADQGNGGWPDFQAQRR